MPSPLMFESSDEEHESSNLGKISSVHEVRPDESGANLEDTSENYKRLERLQTLLTGVPPPPAFTVSQFDACEILVCLQKNFGDFEWKSSKDDLNEIKGKMDQLINNEWPLNKEEQWFDVSYNLGSVCEELALLTSKYQERYVGNETSSSVNSFFSKSPIQTASAKKRARRRAWGHSPGRRLSHLARRRHTFSSANLQQNVAKSLPDKKKMILVHHKKSQACRKGRNSASKISGNKRRSSKDELTASTKRALFQSPDNDKKTGSLVLSSPRTKSARHSKRALWPDKPDVDKENGRSLNANVSDGKRAAEVMAEGYSNAKKKCFKSLSFSEDKKLCTERSIDKSMPSLLPQELSHLHRQKLLWAVSNALRSEGIGMKHDLSKLCMSELFRISKEVWLKKRVSEERNGSTSDKMLEIANKFSGDVIRKVKTRLDMLKNSDNSNVTCKSGFLNNTTENSNNDNSQLSNSAVRSVSSSESDSKLKENVNSDVSQVNFSDSALKTVVKINSDIDKSSNFSTRVLQNNDTGEEMNKGSLSETLMCNNKTSILTYRNEIVDSCSLKVNRVNRINKTIVEFSPDKNSSPVHSTEGDLCIPDSDSDSNCV